MSAKVDRFMPIFVGDYLADTTDLTTEEHGAYLLLLMALWRNDGRLPCDPPRLAKIVGLSTRRWSAVWVIIGRFFDLDDGHISQGRVLREIENAKLRQRRASDNGTLGAAKRWPGHSQGITVERATATPEEHSQPLPSPSSLSPVLSASEPDPSPARSNGSAKIWTGYLLRELWGRRRAEAFGGLPWNRPGAADGKDEAFASSLRPDESADVEASMLLALKLMRSDEKAWSDERNRKLPAFGFGSWLSGFTALRERLHHVAPKAKSSAPPLVGPAEPWPAAWPEKPKPTLTILTPGAAQATGEGI